MVLVRQVCSSRRCLALRCGVASRWCCAPFLLAVASRWCHRLPRRISTQRLQRSGNLFRTDFRFAPSLPQRFACGLLPFTRDMGVHGLCGRVPDSAGSICPQGVDRALRSKLLTAVLHLKHHLPSCSCSQARRQPHPAQVRQIASQTGVLPRRMRLVAGRGHCSSKSPRARILVLGTSGAHWPAR